MSHNQDQSVIAAEGPGKKPWSKPVVTPLTAELRHQRQVKADFSPPGDGFFSTVAVPPPPPPPPPPAPTGS